MFVIAQAGGLGLTGFAKKPTWCKKAYFVGWLPAAFLPTVVTVALNMVAACNIATKGQAGCSQYCFQRFNFLC
jgi:hypothetical protein